MDNKSFLFGFEGRINRAKYWLVTLLILCAMIFSLLLLALICLSHGISTGPLSINLVAISASFHLNHDEGSAALFPRIATVGLKLMFGWCYAAASIKRLHDRNKSGWWIFPYLVASGLYDQFGDRLGDSWPATVIGFATYFTLLGGLIEMLFLKGTNGPNRFGPDPLAAIEAGARWDQISETKLVPHSAGPLAGA